MSVDRLSVTVPSELGAALRALAEARGETISTVVTEAIASTVRLEALDRALAAATRRFGPVPEDLVARAVSDLTAPLRTRRRRKARPRPR